MSVSVANGGRGLAPEVPPTAQTFTAVDDDKRERNDYDTCQACDDTCAVLAPGVILFGAEDAEGPQNTRVGLFDACESCDATCWTGCVAPCCLIGATVKNANKRQGVAGPCDGCGGHCCAAYALSVVEMSSFPFMTALYQYFCVRPTIRGYADADDACCSVCAAYVFCYRCAVCQDYKTSARVLEKSR